MVKSTLQEKKTTIFRSQGLTNQKSSHILVNEAFFRYKMCCNFKSIKAMKENISYICRSITSKDLR